VPSGSCSARLSMASSAPSLVMKQTKPVLRCRARSSCVRGHMILTEYRSPVGFNKRGRLAAFLSVARFLS